MPEAREDAAVEAPVAAAAVLDRPARLRARDALVLRAVVASSLLPAAAALPPLLEPVTPLEQVVSVPAWIGTLSL